MADPHSSSFYPVTGSIAVGLATRDSAANALAELRPEGLELRFRGDTLTACTEGLESHADE